MRVIVGILCLLVATLTANAHETWLLPARGRLAAPGPVILAISSGMEFPKPDTAIDIGNARRTVARIGTHDVPVEPLNAIGGQTILRARLDRTGLAKLWLDLPAVAIELTPDLVEIYFDEIRADPALLEAWKREGRTWREYYAKFSTTFVRVGAPDPTDRAWAEPIGGPLEIVPEADPTALGPDPTIGVRVLKFGQPIAGLSIAAQERGVRDWQRTDAEGRARFALKGSGPWLIHATELNRVAKVDADWESWFATLTIPRQ